LSKSSLKKLRKALLDTGYCKEVLIDEMNAYILVEKEFLVKNKIWNKEMKLIRNKLRILIDKFDPDIRKKKFKNKLK
jgi:hypothetical protein